MNPAPTTYFYQVQDRSEWMRAWVTDDGCVSIMSDYGNYAYWWGNPGTEIRRFLVRAGHDYIMNKLAEGQRELQVEETKKAVLAQINEARDEFEDEDVFDELVASVEDIDDEASAQVWFNTHYLDEVELTGCHITDYPQQLRAFMERLWPRFVEKLKAELEQAH